MIDMRLKAEFLKLIERLPSKAANENCCGDTSFIVRNLDTQELTFTLAQFARHDGAP